MYKNKLVTGLGSAECQLRDQEVPGLIPGYDIPKLLQMVRTTSCFLEVIACHSC